ncbi:MAG: transposase [Candidatus Micrarchaeaceae archaeon]
MKRAILLQIEATAHKRSVLDKFMNKAITYSNQVLATRTPDDSAASLQARMYRIGKEEGFNAQVPCEIIRSVAKSKGKKVNGVTVKFNVPRNCKTFRTKGFFFVELGLYPRDRLAVPIRKNRNLDRFNGLLGSGWTCKTFGLTPSLEIVAYLSKEDKPLAPRRNVLGIDINAKDFAYTILTPEGKVLKQGYLGQQIWVKKRHFEERRALLQHFNNLKALKRMRHDQRNYVKTNIGQMVREIILLAEEYNADISIEKLRRFKPKGRVFNKKVMTIPLALFRKTLEARCFDHAITLNRVDAYHTSKWCSRCGAVGKGHDGSVYSLFKCRTCGQVVNADRKASLAVAVKTLVLRNPLPNQNWFQINTRRVPVNGLIRDGSDAPGLEAVPAPILGRGKPTASVVGS